MFSGGTRPEDWGVYLKVSSVDSYVGQAMRQQNYKMTASVVACTAATVTDVQLCRSLQSSYKGHPRS